MVGFAIKEMLDDAGRDLGDLQGVGEARSIEIAVAQIQNLGLPLEPSEACRVDNTTKVDFASLSGVIKLFMPRLAPFFPLAHVVPTR